MATFQQLMSGFGVVTVMNARLYALKENEGYTGNDKPINPTMFEDSDLYLDTLKIANLTQEGPTKTITGGQYANPLIKYGKTMTCEMQDALGRGAVLERFFGCEFDTAKTRLSVGDKFPGAFALEGETFFIDQKTGDKVPVYILIPQFTPDAILSLTQDSEGDATVFDLNGSVSVTKIMDSVNDTADEDGKYETERSIFYEIRESRWFSEDAMNEEPKTPDQGEQN